MVRVLTTRFETLFGVTFDTTGALFVIIILPERPVLLFPSVAVIFTGPSTLLYVSAKLKTPSVSLTEVKPRVPVPFDVNETIGELFTIFPSESLAIMVTLNPLMSAEAGAVTVYEAIIPVVVTHVAPTILPDVAVMFVVPTYEGVVSMKAKLPSVSLMQFVLSRTPALEAIVKVWPFTPFASTSFIVPFIITAWLATQVEGKRIRLMLFAGFVKVIVSLRAVFPPPVIFSLISSAAVYVTAGKVEELSMLFEIIVVVTLRVPVPLR